MTLPTFNQAIMVLGPTASGKTKLAVQIANIYQAEIISADSRQVYQELNIGSGKDLKEYTLGTKSIIYHLIDICNLKAEFTLSDYVKASNRVIDEMSQRLVTPVICGGSGLYLETFLKEFEFAGLSVSKDLRKELERKSADELRSEIKQLHYLQSQPDINQLSKLRLIRLYESLTYDSNELIQSRALNPIIIGIHPSTEIRWQRIQNRLEQRFKEGMIDEVEQLMNDGVSSERLQRLGLEYKYISKYLMNELSLDEMKTILFFEIRRFSKRQMTYFRKLEKDGHSIFWIDGNLSSQNQFEQVMNFLTDKK
ncbi:MAG: tRNA (adenosine(37)-N6)-dimethylallyltransferase MiaA [Bacteroidia bacterium]